MTKQRKLILQIIQNSMIHPTAEEIFYEAKKLLPSISQGTVYRNLNLMVEDNEIRRIIGLDSKEHYDKNIKVHDHFICEKCGKIYDIFDLQIDKLIENKVDLHVKSYELVVKGICGNCLK